MNALLKKARNKKGFTLIEMIVVIAIIAILIALIAPKLTQYIRNAKDTEAAAGAKTVYTSAQAYVAAKLLDNIEVAEGTYDQDDATHDISGYLSGLKSGATYTWTVDDGVVTDATFELPGGQSARFPLPGTATE